MLELYHWEPNGNSLKVMIALGEAGLEFRGHFVDILAFEQFRPEFLALNSAGLVPVLVKDGVAMYESNIINEFIAESCPNKHLAPLDAKGWYETLVLAKWLDAHLAPSVSTLGWHAVMVAKMKTRDPAALRKAVDAIPVPERKAAWLAAITDAYTEEQLADSRRKVGLAVARMEEILSGNEWLVGSNYSIVDMDAFAMARTLPELAPEQVNGEATPGIMAWLVRVTGRPAVQAALAMRRAQDGDRLYAPGPEHSRWG